MNKQFLTTQQINEICTLIPLNRSIPTKVAESIAGRIREKLRNDLKSVQIYPQIYENFKKEIVKYYYKTLTQAGEAVGIITAQSIGERQTQTTLNSFHSAGLTIKTVVTGVPRFSELLNATKEPKMVNCLIFLTESFDEIFDIRKRIGNSFTEITLKRLVKSHELVKGPLEKWHYLFCDMYKINKNLGWRLRLTVDLDILYEYQIKMKEIKKAVEDMYPVTILYKPESYGIIDVFIDEFKDENCSEIDDEEKEDKENEDDEKDDKENEDDEKDDKENEDDEKEDKEDKENEDDVEKEEIEIEEMDKVELVKDSVKDIPHEIEQLITIEDKILPQLLNVKITGISGIKEIFFEKRKSQKDEQWVITTEGSNLYDLFVNPLVDKKQTLCNNMWEIYRVFGIEATRQFLIEEFMDVVTSDGTFVNSSHVELLVDLMIYTGSIISISRYGQKKVGSGPLSKASFEESLENFLKAGLNSEKETTDGVSASIMLGKLPKIGTGVFDLKMDIDAIKRIPPSVFKGSVKEKEPEIKIFKKTNSLFNF